MERRSGINTKIYTDKVDVNMTMPTFINDVGGIEE